ncbi:hypothetical protein HGRIS_010382 [Hohenbuehelia grisea]
MAILLGERAHLIEFPSVLLPPGATTGSIVNIAVHQNHAEEKRRDSEFWALQNDILQEFGQSSPEPPQLQVRNITQTSITLQWPPIKLATAKLRSLDIYRNDQRLASIPSPTTNTSTKLSGLQIDTDYTFRLILRTTAGTFPSNTLRVHTHTMADTSGIRVCFGNVQDEVLLENAKLALKEMKAEWSDKIQIDTTHFVCTTPAATTAGAQAVGNTQSAPGVEYQRALQLSIPVVQPHWILACHAEKKMVPIAAYYLGANPTVPANSPPFNRPQSMSQASLSRPPTSPPPNSAGRQPGTNNRASMPAPLRTTSTSPPSDQSTFVNQESTRSRPAFEPTPEEPGETEPTPSEPEAATNASDDKKGSNGELHSPPTESVTPTAAKRKSRSGTMNRDFKFPSPVSSPVVESSPTPKFLPDDPSTSTSETTTPKVPAAQAPGIARATAGEVGSPRTPIITPSSIEVPPPPPVEKERSLSSGYEDAEEDLGPTEDIPL